jgi:hypothetical protein
VNVTAVDPVA